VSDGKKEKRRVWIKRKGREEKSNTNNTNMTIKRGTQ